MQIKINEKIFSVSPFLSTHWSRIGALHIKGGLLAVTLVDGDTIHIPNLPPETIEQIFHYHVLFMENEINPSPSQVPSQAEIMKQIMGPMSDSSVCFAFSTPDGLGSPMQHDPAQANAPNLPPEILQKIGAVARIFNPEETKVLPEGDPSCNCFHCQIVRALHNDSPSIQAPIEHLEVTHDDIPDEELRFEQWIIAQTADKLFTVTNKLDNNEKYNVFLGEPVGCTCGAEGCEHILAVLKS